MKHTLMMQNNGLIHIYCGDGKGKTTAALGLLLRAAGCGKKILLTRFMKRNDSSELCSLQYIPGVDIMPNEKEFCMIYNKDRCVNPETKAYYNQMFFDTVSRIQKGDYDLLVMDELVGAVRLGVVDKQPVVEFLQNKPQKLEVVMTGRNPDEQLIEIADYVSEIKKIKHPFDKGIKARKGIEM